MCISPRLDEVGAKTKVDEFLEMSTKAYIQSDLTDRTFTKYAVALPSLMS